MNDTRSSRLLYLDGVRGLAALYVALHHAYLEVIVDRLPVRLPFLVRHGTNWLSYGQASVDVFIVLSGYCLMLPAARSGGGLRGGVGPYLLRRARRILPPYYVALLLFLLLIALAPGMNRVQGVRWDTALPALTPGAVASHLLLIQNWNRRWLYAIDPPMWSVATEWQIYFLFPLLLLPLWRRFGSTATVGAAFILGLLPHFVLHAGDSACPWFVGLFALGMAAASVRLLPASASERALRQSAWGCSLTALAFLVAATFAPGFLWGHFYLMDALVGLGTALFLRFCTGHCDLGLAARPWALRLVETPLVLLLGSFSYSLYLVHFPLLSLFHLCLRPLHLSAAATLLILIGAGVPATVFISYLFHLAFERPFMPGAPKRIQQAEASAAVSPAP